MIMGALTTAFLTSINLSSTRRNTRGTPTTRNSSPATSSATRRPAGATNSITGSVDAEYGITLPACRGCSVPSGDTPIVRFEWLDRTSAAGQNYNDIAVYYYVPPASGKSGQSCARRCGTSPDFASTNRSRATSRPSPPRAAIRRLTARVSGTVSLTVSEVQHPTQPYTMTASTRPRRNRLRQRTQPARPLR